MPKHKQPKTKIKLTPRGQFLADFLALIAALVAVGGATILLATIGA